MKSYRITLLFVTAILAALLLAGSLRLARGAGVRGPAHAEGVAALNAPAPLTTHPMSYTGPYSVTALGALGGSSSLAYDVNRHGHVVGTAAITGNQTQRAFLWQDADHDLIGDNGEMENVGADDGLRSYATAIADSGYIAGVTVYDNCFCGSDEERGEDWLPFVRTPAGDLTELHGLGYIAEAQAINEAGTVVGSAYMIDTLGEGNRPAVWRGGNLSHPWDFLGGVNDINDAGDLVGGQYDAWNARHGSTVQDTCF